MHRRIISSSTSIGSYPEPTASECVPTWTISSVTRNSVAFSVPTPPTGTRYIILVSPTDFTVRPVDFTSNYIANAAYGSATDLNGGVSTPRVTWDLDSGAGAISIAGLAANTIYYFKLVSFKANANNDFNTRNYNTINVLSTYTRTSR